MALVDTGSGASLIRERFYKTLKDQGKLEEAGVDLYDVSNNQVLTKGKVTLKFQFGDVDQLDQEFIVVNAMKLNCIIGQDAIEKHEMIIDGKLKTVYRIIFEDGTTEDSFLLTNPYNITIPPPP